VFESQQLLQDILSSARYQRMPLEKIKHAPYNPRAELTPEDPEYQQIKASIINHGMLQPIIYNERTGNAVGGNQRLTILRDMGVDEAVCAVVNLPLQLEMEANIALNRLGNMWDQPKLREAMLSLKQSGYDVEKTAFSPEEVDRITQDMDLTVSAFFTDQDEETAAKAKKTHMYKCPHCGEEFEK